MDNMENAEINKIIWGQTNAYFKKQMEIKEVLDDLKVLVDNYNKFNDKNLEVELFTPVDCYHLSLKDIEYKKLHDKVIKNHELIVKLKHIL